MDRDVAQILALLNDVRGYIDKVEKEAAAIHDSASKAKAAAKEYEGYQKKIEEAQAKLENVKREVTSAEKAKQLLKEAAAKL